ncbi:HlyD family type I secretion periplasmic adaptor subunit [Paludibacterium yongneupense]|uniref:HlyD family type I secretion periplasmic adaptor subunit n=1 Tax=Paludibacterium yongneupense TaxID=400061 RepID=UPI0004120C4B|nr:HlyD family type I secretion periplasmic adaptor subunit [Paludibacterium yongneupense]
MMARAVRHWVRRLADVRARIGRWRRGKGEAAAVDDARTTDFIADVQWGIQQQRPRRPRLFILTVAGLAGAAVLWAALSQVDEVARGEGRVVPSFQNQHIQSLDGGIVAEIRVREGEKVSKGQLLLRIDSTRVESSLGENRAQWLALQAKAARLRALASAQALQLPPAVAAAAPDLAQQETALYASRRQELDTGLAIARQQLAQRTQELGEVRVRREQAQQSFELTSKELAVTAPLQESGAVSDVDLLRLRREVARARGERDMATAQIPRLQAAIAEAARKVQEVELAFRNAASIELSDTLAKLGSLKAGSVALQDRVRLTEVRAPASGEIKRLYLNTVGSVVTPGKDIIELVPSEEVLLVEARVSPRDIAFLHPGQRAYLRFTAYDSTVYGGMEGELQEIGADTLSDEKGQPYYLVRVRTRASAAGGRHWRIIPGMVVQVDILTGKKSILSYLLKPVLRAKAQALTER